MTRDTKKGHGVRKLAKGAVGRVFDSPTVQMVGIRHKGRKR